MKAVDKAKLMGYCTRWVDAKYILGCAVFVDILSPCVILSKVMQYDHLDILATLTSLLRSIKEIDKLSAMPVSQWPTYASIITKCTTIAGNTEYQSQHLKRFDAAKSYYTSHSSAYCTEVSECIKSRLA